MRKHSNRRVRPCNPPTLVALHCAPDVGITERLAVEGISGGWATTTHFNQLLECADLLLLAATEKKADDEAEIAHLGRTALANIRDRYYQTKRIGATGEELKALRVLVDISEDWWKRQSGALFKEAVEALDRYRDIQKEVVTPKNHTIHSGEENPMHLDTQDRRFFVTSPGDNGQ